VPGATRRCPRTQRGSRRGWRRHVRAPGGLSRLHSYGALLDRDAPGADVQGSVRLRETLESLTRVEAALRESESRHAFLLRLGDALRLLVDPLAIQEEASRLLGERLRTDRAYYAEID